VGDPVVAVRAAPIRRRLSRADVVQAGVELTREHGLAGLSLSAVATRLKIQRPSLYHHLPGGFDELRSAVIEALTELEPDDTDPAEPATPAVVVWEQQVLHRLATANSEVPDLVPYLITDGRNERRSLEQADRLVGLLLESDIELPIAEAFVIVHAYITGWVCAQLQSQTAAEQLGLDDLAGVLGEVGKLDREQTLLDGFRALLAGLSVKE
jgi:AcrR family transcriptional regulator